MEHKILTKDGLNELILRTKNELNELDCLVNSNDWYNISVDGRAFINIYKTFLDDSVIILEDIEKLRKENKLKEKESD